MLFRRKKGTDAAAATHSVQPAGGVDMTVQPAGNSLFGRKTAVMTALPVNFGLDAPGPTAGPAPVQTAESPTLSMAPGYQEPPVQPAHAQDFASENARSLPYQQAGQAPDGQSAQPMHPLTADATGFHGTPANGQFPFEPAETAIPFVATQPMHSSPVADSASPSTTFAPIAPQGLSNPSDHQPLPTSIGGWASAGQPLPLHGTLSDDDLPLTPGGLSGIHNVVSHGVDPVPAATSHPTWEQPGPTWMTPEAPTLPVAPIGEAFQQAETYAAQPSQSPFHTSEAAASSGFSQDDFYALDAPSFEPGSVNTPAAEPAASPFQGWADTPAAMAPIGDYPAFEPVAYDNTGFAQPVSISPEVAAFEPGDGQRASTDTLWIDEDGEAILSLDEDGYACNTSLIEPDLPAPLNAQEQALLAELERQQAAHPDEVDEFNADFVLQEAHQLLEEPLDYLSWQTQHPQVIHTPEVESDPGVPLASFASPDVTPITSGFVTMQEPTDLRNFSQPAVPAIEYFDEDEDGGTFNLSEPEPFQTVTPVSTLPDIASLASFQSVTPIAVEEPVSPLAYQSEPPHAPSALTPELADNHWTPQPVEPVDSVLAHSDFGSGSWQELEPTAPQPLPQSPVLGIETMTESPDVIGPVPVTVADELPDPGVFPSVGVTPESLQPNSVGELPSNVTALNPPLGVITINDFALDAIRVVLSHELSAQHRLYVAQVNSRCVLIGQTAGRIELLQFIELPELSPQTAFLVAEAATSVSRRLLFVQVGTWQGHILVDNSGMLVQKSPAV